MLFSLVFHSVFIIFPDLASALQMLLDQYADVRTRSVMLYLIGSYVVQLDADYPYFPGSC